MFYTESDPETNRPFAVKAMDLKTFESTLIYEDPDNTHYVEIGVTKDKKFLVIASNTKEDNEILVMPRLTQQGEDGQYKFQPIRLIQRETDVRCHVDHLRDFFIMITTKDSKQKNFKLVRLKD